MTLEEAEECRNEIRHMRRSVKLIRECLAMLDMRMEQIDERMTDRIDEEELDKPLIDEDRAYDLAKNDN
jgi:hypothetical protein